MRCWTAMRVAQSIFPSSARMPLVLLLAWSVVSALIRITQFSRTKVIFGQQTYTHGHGHGPEHTQSAHARIVSIKHFVRNSIEMSLVYVWRARALTWFDNQHQRTSPQQTYIYILYSHIAHINMRLHCTQSTSSTYASTYTRTCTRSGMRVRVLECAESACPNIIWHCTWTDNTLRARVCVCDYQRKLCAQVFAEHNAHTEMHTWFFMNTRMCVHTEWMDTWRQKCALSHQHSRASTVYTYRGPSCRKFACTICQQSCAHMRSSIRSAVHSVAWKARAERVRMPPNGRLSPFARVCVHERTPACSITN